MSATTDETTVLVPLRSWIENEEKKTAISADPQKQRNSSIHLNKKWIVCQTTVAYGIAELLLLHAKNHASASNNGQSLEEEIRIDNFAVCVCNDNAQSALRPWEDIKGVSMLSPSISISIEEPSYLSFLMIGEEEECDGQIINGRCLEVEELTSPPVLNNSTTTATAAVAAPLAAAEKATGNKTSIGDHNHCLYLLAKLLYELFSRETFFDDALRSKEAHQKEPESKLDHHPQPPHKKLMLSRAQVDYNQLDCIEQIPHVTHMQKKGLPASLCLMMQNLLECDLGDCGQTSGDAYTSLEVVAKDLHLLLLDPDRFLFDKEVHVGTTTDNMQLHYREGKLYGRDKEETLITDAFCRVSRGTSEAIFIGGFSGCGKSMLVNGLRTKVDVVGGYAIKHKFDAISQTKPLFGVISAFDHLCLMIKDRSTAQGLAMIAKQLREEFGVDFNLLMRLLPNVSMLSHEFAASPAMEVKPGEKMNAKSVCFTLLRFVRVVSSPRHPVMLFLDDLQWSDDTALEVIHTILSDTMGSCVLFVGTYRDNEVQADHAIFDLTNKLETSNVQTTKVSLTGLNREDLNTMISDALCLYPRICKSLSDNVFEKTKGNPFFVLEFMQSLLGRGLLQYSFDMKRWVWNEAVIRSEEVMDNVIHLLSSKLRRLPESVLTSLKAMACFGTSINEAVIDNLRKSSEFSDIHDSMKRAISDGFVMKDERGHLKFVHDKVREAAYNLIPGNEKKQFHYNLGIILHSNCEGNDVGDTIFLIASQINYGEEYTLKNEELCIKVVKLNMKAGKRAIDGYNHKTAYSFLKSASSLLPEDHWQSYYDLSLRLSLLMASAAYSCCNYDEAESILQGIFEKALSIGDKLSAYSLLGTMFQSQGKVADAYNTYSSILTQLGETIPDPVTPETSAAMITETLNMFEEVYDDEWVKTKMEESLCCIPQFYCEMALAAYFFKPRTNVNWIVCKAVQLCLRNGMCNYAPLSLLNFTVFALKHENISCVFRIGKESISLLERCNMTDRISDCYYPFYAGVAWHVEPFQLSADKLVQAFSSGLSNGNPNVGMYCLMQANYIYTFCGKNLRLLLVEIDYYLHLLKSYKNEVAKNYFLSTRETVSMLIDKGQETCIEAKASYGDMDNPLNKHREMFFFHEAIRCFWLGYTERFKRFSVKCLDMFGDLPQFNTYQIKFYHGLHLIETQKKKKSKETVRLAIAGMRDAASTSERNFTNKLELLEAELYSFEKKSDQAIASYDAAIASACNSGFTHEQGLACEKAGFHCKKEKDRGRALIYFKQARECYEEWGSSMKVDFIQKELELLNI